jgi:hypothetical protein
VLATAATAGDLITTISFYVSSVLGAIPATSGAVTTPYILDGAVTQAKLAAGVAGNGPAFRAYASAGTTVPDATYTKINFASEDFDTNNNFASSRFTPTVAGYYQINANTRFGAMTASSNFLTIYRNGGGYNRGSSTSLSSSGYNYPVVTGLVYCNGTTDYIEIYAYQNSGSSQLTDDGTVYKFTGSLVRAA